MLISRNEERTKTNGPVKSPPRLFDVRPNRNNSSLTFVTVSHTSRSSWLKHDFTRNECHTKNTQSRSSLPSYCVILSLSLPLCLPFSLCRFVSGQSEDRSVVIVFSRACHSSPFGIVASPAPVLTNTAHTFVLRHLIDGGLIQNHHENAHTVRGHTLGEDRFVASRPDSGIRQTEHRATQGRRGGDERNRYYHLHRLISFDS